MVADHPEIVRAAQGPDGQEALRVIIAHERIDHVVHDFRAEDRKEWVRGAEGVPERQGRIERLLPGVGDVARMHHQVVHRRVEDALLRAVTLDLDAAQMFVPDGLGGLPDGVEIPAREFGPDTLSRPLHALYRDGGLDQQGLGRRTEVQDAPGDPFRAVTQGQDGCDGVGAAERDVIMDHAVVPGLRMGVARHMQGVGPVLGAVQHAPEHALLAADLGTLQVQQEFQGLPAHGGEAVDGDVRGTSRFGGDAVIAEIAAVVARLRAFGRLVEAAVIARAQRFAGERHHQQVAQLAAARSVDAVLREALDEGVGPLVAAAVLPGEVAGLGPRLDGAEGQRGARVAVTRAVGAGEYVDVLRIVGIPGAGDRQQEEQERQAFHFKGCLSGLRPWRRRRPGAVLSGCSRR